MENQNIIEPKNLPMWTAASVIVALLALAMAVTDLYRSSAAAVITQAQVLVLSQKMEALSAQGAQPAEASKSSAAKP